MNEKLRKDPLLEEAIESLRKARMLITFSRDTLKHPDIRRALKDEVREVTAALDDALESITQAILRVGDANDILLFFLYRHLDEEKKEGKDE